ncbi:MAG TPA: phosphoglycerate mutase family protein [Cyclobacteriaceae bacterium]|nr:phosphoglycerate mutase family protein [Cyclobacteriaceae bacterium]
MKKTILVFALFSVIFIGCTNTPTPQTITTFILVRHAEKADDGTKDPPLTPDGKIRADELAKVLKETNLDAIYSTAFKRTQETVAPTANSKSLSVLAYEAMKGDEMDRILKTHKGGTVLISGHSNTTPWVANYFLGNEAYPDFIDSDFDNILIVSILEKGNASVTWMSYGMPTN